MREARPTPRRLLVIDDDPSYRSTIGYLLRFLGHTVAEAESGPTGLALLRQQPVDLVMTDLEMPGVTGWDVARLAKAMHPHLPVVLVTGAAQTIPPDQLERTSVDAILGKPCALAELQGVIGLLTRDRAAAENSNLPRRRGREAERDLPQSGTGAEAG